ncbi:hypothetical protein TNCV_811071 [Trichonephila clavipes]|uniref:Secreted protein n=1 Tax=Trichonephila clavipes TaxID=2585209 RepID=A0A8X6VDK0_TRICX|nr:hypothetical protein TNCV_811071 [Trichonephila clavipes]
MINNFAACMAWLVCHWSTAPKLAVSTLTAVTKSPLVAEQCYVNIQSMNRPWPKSVDFHDALNLQLPCRLIIRHSKVPQSVHVWLGLTGGYIL